MARNRKNDYFCEITDEYEGFWSRSGYKSRGYKYYHLILKLHGDYSNSSEALKALKVLEPYIGTISHYETPSDEEDGLKRFEGFKQPIDGYGVINSKLHRKADGWQVDLWLLHELTDWNILAIQV